MGGTMGNAGGRNGVRRLSGRVWAARKRHPGLRALLRLRVLTMTFDAISLTASWRGPRSPKTFVYRLVQLARNQRRRGAFATRGGPKRPSKKVVKKWEGAGARGGP